ncbi:urea ABC transporter ATP-binding protein UrtD [Candidatus Poribacteria bacterium]|nr:urea ABC transporter ATP-binding protein UrtD [Candidatus Poribacteria bacterium]
MPNKDGTRLSEYLEQNPIDSRFSAEKYILFLHQLTAVFDGFKAVDIMALGIEHNELRVVIGPNGAGKTTMCDLISGKTRASSGTVHFEGENITDTSETEIALMGIGRKFQTPTVFDSLTTYQNMELALPGNQNWLTNLYKQITSEEHDQILSILERVGLQNELQTEAKYLSHGQRQWLAISTLVLSSPKLLLVDEPAAGLTDAETELTAELLLELKGDHTLIVIEHDMDFVRQLNSPVTMLHEGKIMAEGTLAELQQNDAVIEAYLGR